MSLTERSILPSEAVHGKPYPEACAFPAAFEIDCAFMGLNDAMCDGESQTRPPKQLRAIVTAYENGVFELPARSKMVKVAKTEGLSRSTYGEHLRKAMLQIIENSYPVLKLYDKGPMKLRAAD